MKFISAIRLNKRMQNHGRDEPVQEPTPVPPEPPIEESPPEHPQAPE